MAIPLSIPDMDLATWNTLRGEYWRRHAMDGN